MKLMFQHKMNFKSLLLFSTNNFLNLNMNLHFIIMYQKKNKKIQRLQSPMPFQTF